MPVQMSVSVCPDTAGVCMLHVSVCVNVSFGSICAHICVCAEFVRGSVCLCE